MNAHQRKKDKRYRLKLADKFIELVDEIISELRSGKTTIEEVKHDIERIKDAIRECA